MASGRRARGVPWAAAAGAAAAAAAAWLATPAGAQFLPPLKQRILIPSYWAPCYNPNDPPHGAMTCPWDQVASDTASHNFSAIGAVILNPASGPGPACDAGYLNVSSRVRAADPHIGVLGYVYTSYGARPLAAVAADVDAYFTCYPAAVTGVFLDEASGDCADLPYYAAVAAHVRAKGGVVVLNPGAPSAPCYLAAADVLVTFEGGVAAYAAFQPPAWHLNTSSDRFAHIVYGAVQEAGDHLAAIRLSKTRNAGYVYVTNGTLPNPYAALPAPYIMWDQELRWAVDII
jgi:hypothetical protein